MNAGVNDNGQKPRGMQMTVDDVTGEDLMEAALAWYQADKTARFPVEGTMPGAKFDASLFYRSGDNYLLEGDQGSSIANISGTLFPLFAGISLGFSTPEILNIVLMHDISLEDVTMLGFQGEPETPIKTVVPGHPFLTHQKVAAEVVKAYASHEALLQELESYLDGSPGEEILAGTMCLNEHPELWPASRISAHADLVMKPDDDQVPGIFRDYRQVASSLKYRDDLPNRSPLDFLHRSGLLTEAVIRNQTGLFDMWEDLVFQEDFDGETSKLVLKALAQSTDKTIIKSAVRGLISINADFSSNDPVPEKMLNTLTTFFGDVPAFAPVINSIVLKINLLATDECRDGISKIPIYQKLHDDLLQNQETLGARVAQELLARPANEIGFSEYEVFQKLRLLDLPEQIIDFPREDLINHILDSISTFISPGTNCLTKKEVDQTAIECVSQMIKFLGNPRTLDYTKFEARSEDEKLRLIQSGLDTKRFKGLSRRILGKALENDLGM
jgi:hypothetical protein